MCNALAEAAVCDDSLAAQRRRAAQLKDQQGTISEPHDVLCVLSRNHLHYTVLCCTLHLLPANSKQHMTAAYD